jgi:hypothetical protein
MEFTILVIAFIAAMGTALVLFVSRNGYIAWSRDGIGMPKLLWQTEMGMDDIPDLVDAISRGTAMPRWAALMFNTPDRPLDDDAIALQISFENGKLGVDWVLLAPRNIGDQEMFRAFATARGHDPVMIVENGVSYLRIEDVDAEDFTARVITDMYGLPTDLRLLLVHEGFDWPNKSAAQ